MIISNETRFAKLSANASRALENSFIYLISDTLDVIQPGEDGVADNSRLMSLCPSKELMDELISDSINKTKFKKAYLKQLKSAECQFLIYTIIRSLNEKNYMPIFVCSDAEWETGYLKIFAKFLTKEFGVKLVKAKKYVAEVEKLWKEAKKTSKKPKQRNKAFRKLLKATIKENVQISFDGIKKLEKMDKEFAIDRIAVLLHQTDEPDAVSKKAIVTSITSYADFSKKAAKRVKRAIDDLDLSKKPERWSKKDAIAVAMQVYNSTHGEEEEE